MKCLGATLIEARDGRCVIEVRADPRLSQQHGFFHAGVTSAIADTAAGYAALSLITEDASVLTVEFKISLIAPADGELLRATGTVIRSGRTITAANARRSGSGKSDCPLCRVPGHDDRLSGRGNAPLEGNRDRELPAPPHPRSLDGTAVNR
jgi:uncharacterized protein (TIGR00369 family)